MTTTGQFLVANSTLPSGTALQHLLALQIGTGSGQTVFASQFTATIDVQQVEVTAKAKRAVGSQVEAQSEVEQAKDRKALYCTLRGARVDAVVESDVLWARIGTRALPVLVKAAQSSYAMKGIV